MEIYTFKSHYVNSIYTNYFLMFFMIDIKVLTSTVVNSVLEKIFLFFEKSPFFFLEL